MPRPWSIEWAGRIEEGWIESDVLQDNPLGDPFRRPVWVYLPPGYDDDPDGRYPAIYQIQGMTGQLDMWRNRTAFRLNFPELADQLFARREAPPCILVYVDCWTSYGGSQFIDSPGTGRYHTYLCEEVVPWVDGRYRTRASREHRGIAGKSSGGYGAMVTPMLRPDLFGRLATHAGDALFELCYGTDFGKCARALRDLYGGSWEHFWEDYRSRPAGSRPDDAVLLNQLAMAAWRQLRLFRMEVAHFKNEDQDLNSRRGRVQGMDSQGTTQVIKAQVPMSEMLSYSSTLKSITGGRGSYHMELSHYEEAPAPIQTRSIAEHKPGLAAEEEEA